MQIQLKTSSIMKVPLRTYNEDFKFIVNGEEIKTSRIISDLLSPKISQIHFVDSAIDTFTINTTNKGSDNFFDNSYTRKVCPERRRPTFKICELHEFKKS